MTARPATPGARAPRFAPHVIVRALGEDDAAGAVRPEVDARRVDGPPQRARHRRRVDQPPGDAIEGDLDAGQPGHLVRRRSRAVDHRVGLEAVPARRGHAAHARALAEHAGHALARQHAGAEAHGVGEQGADERHDLHVALALRVDHLVHVRRDVQIRLEGARLAAGR